MSHAALETDSFPASIQVPDTADKTYPTVVANAETNLASRTRYHENTLTGNYIGTALDLLTAAATLTQFVALPTEARLGVLNPFKAIALPLFQNFKWLKENIIGFAKGEVIQYFMPKAAHATGTWTSFSSGTVVNLIQATNASTDLVFFELPLAFRKGTLKAVHAGVLGDIGAANVHGVNLPAAMPRIDLYRYTATVSGVSSGLVGGQVDTSATGAAYDAAHAITLSGLNESLEPSATLFWAIRVTGESGANSLANKFTIQRLGFTVDGGNL